MMKESSDMNLRTTSFAAASGTSRTSSSSEYALVEPKDLHSFVEQFFKIMLSTIKIDRQPINAATVITHIESDKYNFPSGSAGFKVLMDYRQYVDRTYNNLVRSDKIDPKQEFQVFAQMVDLFSPCEACGTFPGVYAILMESGKDGMLDRLGQHTQSHDTCKVSLSRVSELYAQAKAAHDKEHSAMAMEACIGGIESDDEFYDMQGLRLN